jgi:hypothetical protein
MLSTFTTSCISGKFTPHKMSGNTS